VLNLCIFSVNFCSYVLQLLNISKALSGKFIQIGEFSINGSLSSASNNFKLFKFLVYKVSFQCVSHTEKVLFSMVLHFQLYCLIKCGLSQKISILLLR
jgi:hypothetical protein